MTFDKRQYELLDFGGGEKLERFGKHVIRRETPSVDARPVRSGDRKSGWKGDTKSHWQCDARFIKSAAESRWDAKGEIGAGQGRAGHRSTRSEAPSFNDWSVRHGQKVFTLKLAPSGQVGIFPEQADNWRWIEEHADSIQGCRAINLFGYTGGTTMALAQCGVEVTHVDAAKPAVEWARENAAASGLANAPIRWIVDDAISFLRREIKRNKQYEIFVADPPSFGRGPKQTTWKIQRDLEELYELAAALTRKSPKMYIFSCHTPDVGRRDLKTLAHKHLQMQSAHGGNSKGEAFGLTIDGPANRKLASGECFRWRQN